jgi:hypothetical protein
VRWRDPTTGQALPRLVAIFAPVLIGATFHGVGTFLLKWIGLPAWATREREAEKKSD